MPDRTVSIQNLSNPRAPVIEALYCSSFTSKFKGLMFWKGLPPHKGILLVEPIESRINSSIHMFFMNFDITVVWMDQNYRVVDVQIAKKGRPYYAPSIPAKFTLETHADYANYYFPGDQLKVTYVD